MGAFVYTWSFQPGVFIPSCGSGGTGRRASLRSLWPQGREGSNPFFRTNPESAGTPAPRLAHCTPLALRGSLRSVRDLNRRGPLHPAWLTALRLAHCTPLALRGSLRSVRDLNRPGPLHPAWLTALRSPFAARSVPFAHALGSTRELRWQASRRLLRRSHAVAEANGCASTASAPLAPSATIRPYQRVPNLPDHTAVP